MPQDNNTRISFVADGVNNKIKISTPLGASVVTNVSQTHMQNVEEASSGGDISHNSANLIQIGDSQVAGNKGKITNRVEGGKLYQKDLAQSTGDDGEIVNEVKKIKNCVNTDYNRNWSRFDHVVFFWSSLVGGIHQNTKINAWYILYRKSHKS